MPDLVEGFADVKKDNSYFKTIVLRFTEGIVKIRELVNSWVTWKKARLIGYKEFAVSEEVKHILGKNTLKNLFI